MLTICNSLQLLKLRKVTKGLSHALQAAIEYSHIHESLLKVRMLKVIPDILSLHHQSDLVDLQIPNESHRVSRVGHSLGI